MPVAFPPLLVKSRPSASYLEARDTNPSVLLLRLRSTLSKEPKLPRQVSVRRIAGRDLKNNRIHLPGIRTSQHTPSEGEWKRICVNKALEYDAYDILMGTEKEPSPGSDSRLVTSFRGRHSKLVGYIRSTLDASQTETVLMGISILDLPGTWK
ncbi:hypothetical protein DFP72DRAFT_1068137 [Ephemerocybe angulata]|uniref:Uncharacterized protein n=1 Tax=Ephemerocybe angulata TaxID=980116 RepID=A0A8H6M7J1_9AGAR|nr:hypothetical protein DFP72DRAFT_1068137 [Tulosesus angulatus]